MCLIMAIPKALCHPSGVLCIYKVPLSINRAIEVGLWLLHLDALCDLTPFRCQRLTFISVKLAFIQQAWQSCTFEQSLQAA